MLSVSALAICVIVWPTDDPYQKEIYNHEIAHANGWEHPEKHHPKVNGYERGYQAPREYYTKAASCALEKHHVSSVEARALCEQLTGLNTIGCYRRF